MLEEIFRLARSGADLDRRVGGRTPLHVAAFQVKGPAAEALIAAGANPNLLDGGRYDAVTISAGASDDVSTLKALLDAGASAKLVTSVYDGTALIAAVHLGHAGVVRELIRASAPLDHVNNLGWTALLEAVILGDGGPRLRDRACAGRCRGERPPWRSRGPHAARARASPAGTWALRRSW